MLVLRLLVFLISLSGLGAQVNEGVLDLTAWDNKATVALKGNWSFWFQSEPGASPATMVAVPGSWKADNRLEGWGAYRLEVVVSDPPPTDLALYVPLMVSAGEVSWNNERVWKLGDWRATSFARALQTGVVDLHPRAGVNVLEFRIGSYGDLNPGLNETPRIGRARTLVDERSQDLMVAIGVFFGLAVMGLYHVGLYLSRRQETGFLWFGLLTLLFSLRNLLTGSTFLGDLFPTMGNLLTSLWFLTVSGAFLFFSLFLDAVFRKASFPWFRPLALAGAGGYSLAALVLPPLWYVPVLPAFFGYTVLLLVVFAVILFRASARRLVGSWILTAGFFLMTLAVINDYLKYFILLPTPYLGSFGLVAFLAFQSIVLMRRFTKTVSEAEHYSQSLEVINGSLQRFIPREILSFLEKKSIVEVGLGDYTERSLTVMFTDIRDFTALSEAMAPQENFQFINSYLRRMGPVIRKHHGFVDKYIGDGIMALFPGKAEDAVEAALEMRAVLRDYNHQRAGIGYVPLRIGIGLHWGNVMLGTIGESQRMDSTVISDTVNTASRLEGLTKRFGTDILVSGETLAVMDAPVRERFAFQFLSEEAIRGRKEPVKAYGLREE